MKNLSLQEINNLLELCKILATTPFYQKLQAGGVLAIYLTALELNLPVMFCLNGGLHNIEGKVCLSGQAINMMLVNAGWKINFLEMSETCCHLEFINPKDGKVNQFKYTIEEAEKAGYLGIPGPQGTWTKKPKDNWLFHKKDMLFNRCIASGGRKFAPNVLGNCYGYGEIQDDNTNIIASEEKEIENKSETQKQLNYKGYDDVEQFKKRHKIEQGEKIYDYVINIATRKKIDPDQVLNEAFLNEEKFIESYKRFEVAT